MNNFSFYKGLYEKALHHLVENGLNSLPSIIIHIVWMRSNRILGQIRSKWQDELLLISMLFPILLYLL